MEIASDTWVMFKRHLQQTMHNPVLMFIGLIQPILYLCLFGPLLISFSGQKGFENGNSWQVYVPGLLVQLGLFGTTFAGFGLIGEWRMGILERMRVTPVSRLALLLGRVFRDAFVLVLQSIVLLIGAFALGLRADILGVFVGLIFVALLAVSAASLSYAAALTVKSENAFAPLLNLICIPLLLLSGIILPMSLAPPWLNYLSMLNPLRYLVEAMRQVFLGHFLNVTVLVGTIIALGLAAFAVAVGARTFQRENA